MNYFNLTDNISKIDRTLRIFTGMVLLLATPMAIAAGLHPTILPMIAGYLILTSIMNWDPIGYVIEIVFRMIDQAHATTATSDKSAFRIHSCRGG